MMNTMMRWIRDAWLIVGVTLLLVLLLDRALLALIPEQGQLPQVVPGASAVARRDAAAYGQANWVDDYYREHRQARSLRWEPYVYWRRQAFVGKQINIDAAGHRQTLPLARGDDPLEVWVFGGSTIWGTGVRDTHTIPSELARLLRQRGIDAEVTNLGESGYVSSQGLISLLRLLQAGQRPDLVVFYDGVNDVFAALQSGQAGIPQNENERRKDFRVTNGLDNYLAGFPAILEGVQRLAMRWSGSTPLTAPEVLATRVIYAYLVNVRAIRALGQSFGFTPVFFWQPSIFSRAQPDPDERRIIDASLAYHRDLQRAADAEIRQRGPEKAGVVSLSGLFDQQDDPVYLDFCHLSEAGNRQVAAALLDHLPLTSSP